MILFTKNRNIEIRIAIIDILPMFLFYKFNIYMKHFLSFISFFLTLSTLFSQNSEKHFFDLKEKEDSIIIKIKQKYLSIKSYHETGIYNYMVHTFEDTSKDKYRDEGTYQLFLDLRDEKMVFESNNQKIRIEPRENFTIIGGNLLETKLGSSKKTGKWDKKNNILYNKFSLSNSLSKEPKDVMVDWQVSSVITPFLLPYPKVRPNIFIEKLPWIIEKDSTKQEKYYKISYKRRTFSYFSEEQRERIDSINKTYGDENGWKLEAIHYSDILETYWVRQKDYVITKAKIVYTSKESELIWQGEFVPVIDGELPKNIFDKKDD